MKMHRYVLTAVAALATSISIAQVQQQPGMGQSGPLGQPSGQHIPGMGEPGLGGSDQTPGQPKKTQTSQSNAPKVDDDTLQRQVHEQLARSNEFNDVRITVNDGVVTLEGSVPQKQDRKQAKQLAESVPGVRKVREKLSIRTGGPSASAGANTVGGTSGAATEGVNPETSSNNAGSISGNTSAASGTQAGTSSMGQSGASTSTAPSTNPGTTPGSNAGSSTSPNPPQASGSQSTAAPSNTSVGTTLPDNVSLQGQLQTAFRNDPNLAHDSITANVTDTTIELTGSVATGKDRDAAKSLAESYKGNRKVVDHLTVGGAATTTPANSTTSMPTNPPPQPPQR